jgi:type I restriction enzyme S subunit
MAHYKIAIPTPDIAERFGQIARNLIGRASSNAHESRTLSSLRDSLLPKLISGELRVKDAERFVARTAA